MESGEEITEQSMMMRVQKYKDSKYFDYCSSDEDFTGDIT